VARRERHSSETKPPVTVLFVQLCLGKEQTGVNGFNISRV